MQFPLSKSVTPAPHAMPSHSVHSIICDTPYLIAVTSGNLSEHRCDAVSPSSAPVAGFGQAEAR
jgi:hypothetical protein